jgi:hypothetical protein
MQWIRSGRIPRELAPKIGRRVFVDVPGLVAFFRAEGVRQAQSR